MQERKIMRLFIILLSIIICLCSCTTNEETRHVQIQSRPLKTTESSKKPKEILVDYLLENGQSDSGKYYISFNNSFNADFYTFFVVYNSSTQQLSFERYESSFVLPTLPNTYDDIKTAVKISCNTGVVQCYYRLNDDVYEGMGTLDKNRFGQSYNDQLTYLHMTGENSSLANTIKSLFSSIADLTLKSVDLEFKARNIGTTLRELGYVHY